MFVNGREEYFIGEECLNFMIVFCENRKFPEQHRCVVLFGGFLTGFEPYRDVLLLFRNEKFIFSFDKSARI